MGVRNSLLTWLSEGKPDDVPVAPSLIKEQVREDTLRRINAIYGEQVKIADLNESDLERFAKIAADAAAEAAEQAVQRVKGEVSGFLSTASLSNLVLMIPVVGVGALLAFRLFNKPDGLDTSLYWPTVLIALLVAVLLAVVSWPGLMPNRSTLAKSIVGIGFLLLNTGVLAGATLGLVDVAENPAALPTGTAEATAESTEGARDTATSASGSLPVASPTATTVVTSTPS